MSILLGIVCVVAIVGIFVWRKAHHSHVEREVGDTLRQARRQGLDEASIARLADRVRANNEFPAPKQTVPALWVIAGLLFSVGIFNQIMFYAEPGYVYHVRTIAGEERVVSGTGYHYYLFGRITPWKREMSAQAVVGQTGDSMAAESDSTSNMSAGMPPLAVTLLDQVTARVSATARFQLPVDEESFLKIAHAYRTPENLLRTSLIPQFKETLKATGSLMSAEVYFSGGRSQFQNEFETQMMDGIFMVERQEIQVKTHSAKGSANSAKGVNQDEYGDSQKTVFVVNKLLNDAGHPLIKESKAKKLGIVVVEARVTDLVPNDEFQERMKLKQKASADRAIAREQRIQEEEQKLLVEAKGEREVAERQAAAKVDQIERTTNADTEKQLAITEALKLKEQAAIEKQTAEIVLARDQITAQSVKVLADAAAYEKEVILKADNALAQKLETEERIQQYWADAYAKRAVPQYVFGGGSGSGGTPKGGDSEVSTFMQMMTMQAAKALNYDRSVQQQPAK